MPAKKISIEAAKPNKLFYFVANVVVYRESDGMCLILQRDMREKVHPGRYGVPGGKLEWEDLDLTKPSRVNGDVLDFENAIASLLKRETFEEAGIELQDDIVPIGNVVFVRPDEIPVVLVKFAAKYKSGEIVLEKGAFTDYAWVNEKSIANYECIDGIKDEVAKTIQIFAGTSND